MTTPRTTKATNATKSTATKAKTTKTPAKKATTPAVATPDLTSADTVYGFKVIARQTVDIHELRRLCNVRSLANEQEIDPNLLDSLRVHGVLDPILVNSGKFILDGLRRTHHLKQLDPAELKPVPVVVLDIEDKDIPLLQYLCGLAKGLTSDEKNTAVLMYATENKDLNTREIAEKFQISHVTVAQILKVQNDAPSLVPLMINNVISRTAANELIQSAKDNNQDPEEIAQKVKADILKKSEENPTKQVAKAALKKIVSQHIPIVTDKSRSTITPAKALKDLFIGMTPIGDVTDGIQEYTIKISPDLYSQIQALIMGESKNVATKPEFSFEVIDLLVDAVNCQTKQNTLNTIYFNVVGTTTTNGVSVAAKYDTSIYLFEDDADYWLNHLKAGNKTLFANFKHDYFNHNGVQVLELVDLDTDGFRKLVQADDQAFTLLDIRHIATENQVQITEEPTQWTFLDLAKQSDMGTDTTEVNDQPVEDVETVTPIPYGDISEDLMLGLLTNGVPLDELELDEDIDPMDIESDDTADW